jgi:hypothetical protein
MTKLRKWAEPIDVKDAERCFSRFVRHVTRSRGSGGGAEGRTDDTTVVASPNRPPRREDEDTTTIRTTLDEPSVNEISKRRLLGQPDIGAFMDAQDRKSFLVALTALYRHGHLEDVAAEVERVRSTYSSDVELHGALADFFLERGDLPRAVDLLFFMIDAYFERADVAAARRCLERVRALDPGHRRLKSFEKILTVEVASRSARRE